MKDGGEGGRGLATINLNVIEGSQNRRTWLCLLKTNQMTLSTTVRAKNFTFLKFSVFLFSLLLAIRKDNEGLHRMFFSAYINS